MIYSVSIKAFFKLKYLVVFLTGIIFGFVFMLLIYLYIVILALKRKSKKKHQQEKIDDYAIDLLIKDAQQEFKNKKIRKEIGLGGQFKKVNADLSLAIAKKYYPTSEYPLLELTVGESLELSNYITQRINDFLSAKILAPFKNRTLAQIKGIYDVKTKVEKTKVVKVAKKLGVTKIGKTVMGVLNILNPAYWLKKITVDKLYDIIIVKICLASIEIVGEETYKIYSKSVFEEKEEFDIDKLYSKIIIDSKEK